MRTDIQYSNVILSLWSNWVKKGAQQIIKTAKKFIQTMCSSSTEIINQNWKHSNKLKPKADIPSNTEETTNIKSELNMI
jgi:hypothetical protein